VCRYETPDPGVEVGDGTPATCSYCGSEDAIREHSKGPSPCRPVHYCTDREQPFEAMW